MLHKSHPRTEKSKAQTMLEYYYEVVFYNFKVIYAVKAL